jgi:hypothetical protein
LCDWGDVSDIRRRTFAAGSIVRLAAAIWLEQEAGMIRSSLNPGQRRTVEIIEALGFGIIERLSVRDGLPYFEPDARIIQAIKLGPEPEHKPDRTDADTLKKEFGSLFEQLSRLRDGIVNIEVRHGAPFKLVLERRYEELL